MFFKTICQSNLTVFSNYSYGTFVSFCFQNTILSWIPCCFLIISSIFYFSNIQKRKSFSHNWLNILKLILSTILILINLTSIFFYFIQHLSYFPSSSSSSSSSYSSISASPSFSSSLFFPEKQIPLTDILGPAILVISFSISILWIEKSRRIGDKKNSVLFIYWLMILVVFFIKFLSYFNDYFYSQQKDLLIKCHMILNSLSLLAVFIQFILSGFFIDKYKFEKNKKNYSDKINPELNACVVSKLTYWWINRLLITGYKKSLEVNDLWDLNSDLSSKYIYSQYEPHWEKRNQIYKKNISQTDNNNKQQLLIKSHLASENETFILEKEKIKIDIKTNSSNFKIPAKKKISRPSLWITLFSFNAKNYLFCALLKFIHDVCLFFNQKILQAILVFIEDPDAPFWHGYMFALSMTVVALVQSLLLHQYFHLSLLNGIRARIAITSAIYKKTLKLSNESRKKSTQGEIVNLMSTDAQKFLDISIFIHMLWSAPFQIFMAIFFLYSLLGPAVFSGIGVMIILIPINAFIAKKMRTFNAKQMKTKDQRIKLTAEILNGIKVLKLYAWEDSFRKKILDIREIELSIFRKMSYCSAASAFLWGCSPLLVSLATFATYVLSSPSNILTPQKAFVSLSLFNILRFPMSMLPSVIATIIQTTVSVKRLENFFINEELDESNVSPFVQSEKSAVEIKDGSFAWETGENSRNVLEEINMSVDKGSLVGLVGHVGCGKSSLLSTLLGETEKVKGSVAVTGSIAYVSQQAWIQNASIKNNILFNEEYNNYNYNKTISACALQPDLDLLPSGDETEVGEQGITLSGGQKQRVALARAVYSDKEIYLLDDTLAAVDAHVGRHIFDHVIGKQGILKDKTRIFSTHGLKYLKEFDKIFVITNGKITESGNYFQLLSNNSSFSEFLRSHVEDEAEDDEDIKIRDEILEHVVKDKEQIKRVQRSRKDTTRSEGVPSKTPPPPNLSLSLLNIKKDSAPSEDFLKSLQIPTIESPHDYDVSHSEDFFKDNAPGTPMIEKEYKKNLELKPLKSKDNNNKNKKIKKKETVAIGDNQYNSLKKKKEEEEEEDDEIEEKKKKKEEEEEEDDEIEEKKKIKLIKDEKMETGGVKWSIYKVYFKAIGIITSFICVSLSIFYYIFSIGADFWISDWSNSNKNLENINLENKNPENSSQNAINFIPVSSRLITYGLLGLGQSLSVLIGEFTFIRGTIRATGSLHKSLLTQILHCPMYFFETTPIGRLLNVFSKDIQSIDQTLPMSITMWIRCFLAVLGTMFVISFNLPIFLIVILPLILIYYVVQRFYIRTSRQLKRIESISRSPVFSHFGETIQGVSTIRAFKKVEKFVEESEKRVDHSTSTYYPNISSNRWLAIRLEFIGNCLVLSAAIFSIYFRHSITPGMVGLCITYALNVTQTLIWLVRMTSEAENEIVSVERVKDYMEKETEADWVIESQRPSKDWPFSGKIFFDSYWLAYKNSQPALKDINCNILPGERIGIVGRTGAGKSSMTLALFRIIEPMKGRIKIDDLDISDIGLHDLRSKLTIIPQDPVLFSGTLRMNLDPFDNFTDVQVWDSLKFVQLDSYIDSLPLKLSYHVGEGGVNFSVGQRQLLCLARALLRKTKILILDEATAAVDADTDRLIQSTISTQFKGCTTLTIAHRINTIMDYSRIMVLEQGKVIEFDTPAILMNMEGGVFKKLANQAGVSL